MLGSNKFSVGGLTETCGPLIAGILTFSLFAFFKPQTLAVVAANKDLSFSGLYNAIFDWSSIQTGFLFAIYGFVAGKTDGFIGEIRQTRSMSRYNTYLKRAILIGFVLTLVSMPMIVLNHQIGPEDHYWYWIVALWLSLFAWAFCSFARVAYIFGILVRIKEPTGVPAG